ncbi:MAG TPA: histidine kinase dimerization/phospho-acceptor domain-containing protein [Candidatus Nitrosopolaris sp.]|nr:histidine kinase dimerization/phospho-acceptor domain-containing protein [Candidatus Nitrosopolaris sp.]
MSDEAERPDPDRVLVHDFRNLLAVIVNYCELIAAETTDPEAIKADIAEIRTAADRALELTEKLRHRKASSADAQDAHAAETS